LADIEEKKILAPPKYLTKIGQKDYKYPHDYAKGWVQQDYLPVKRKYYFPTEEGYEAKIKKTMEELELRIGKESDSPHGQKPDHSSEKTTQQAKQTTAGIS